LAEQLLVTLECAPGINQPDFRALDSGLGAVDVSACCFDRRLAVIDVGSGDLHGSLRTRYIGTGLALARFEGAGIDLSDDLAFCHWRIVIDQQLLNGAGDLASNLHGDDGVQRTGGIDGGGNAAALNAGGQIIGRHLAGTIIHVAGCGRGPE
jgi:hypothetical protein